MHRHLGQRAALVLSLVIVAAIAGTLMTAPAQAEVGSNNPGPDASSIAATEALAAVQEILDPSDAPSARTTAAPEADRDLTLALRDLRLRMTDLTPTERATAARVTARPSADRTRRSGSVLVHWQSGTDVESAYVDLVLTTVNHVLATYKKAGYRTPESDGTRGGGGAGLLDIYLEDLGSQRLYGYCDSDVAPPSDGPYDTWAYCAFDDNFSEFTGQTPTANLRVTAAHELFHAVQFAYDYFEDGWFMEATATWAEDEVYDGVNDNRQYLAESPLSQPGQSMDQFSGLRQYGDWIFFRFLSERISKSQGGLPTVVRKIWERADGSSKGPDDYSLQAIERVLAKHDTSLPRAFANFAVANRHPARSYSEGQAYTPAPLAQSRSLSRSQPSTGWRTSTLDHLTSRAIRFTPGSSLRSGSRLRVQLDLPKRTHGSAAVITTYKKSGVLKSRYVEPSKSGTASRAVGFDPRSVSRVEVTLVNAGSGYRCWLGTDFSCRGRSTDDGRSFKILAKAIN